MNLNEAIDIWEKLGETNSSNDKVEILKNVEDPLLFKLMLKEYEPLNFSANMLKKVNVVNSGQKVLKLEGIIKFLDRLRSISSTNAKITFVEKFASVIDERQWEWLQKIILGRMGVNVSLGLVLKSIGDVKRLYYLCNDIEETFNWIKDGKDPNDYPVLIGKPIAPMLSNKYKEKEDLIVMAQPKYDGVRVQIHKKGYDIKIFTRQLKDITLNIMDVAKQFENIPFDFIVEGEVLAAIKGGTFQSVMHRINRKHKMENEIPLEVILFDIINWNGKHLFDMSYQERYTILQNFPMVTSGKMGYASDMDDYFQECIDNGYEGIMYKDVNGLYHPGMRTNDVMKQKMKFRDIDCLVTKIFKGTGKFKDTVGAIEIGLKDENDNIIWKQRVGSGLSDFDRAKLMELRDEDDNPIEETIAEIHYGEPTDDGFLRFPVFVCIRDDLSFKDVKYIGDIK